MLKLIQPLFLLLTALTYTLGASLQIYLGASLDIPAYGLGLAAALLTQGGMTLLAEVFRPHNEPLLANATPQQIETLRNRLLYVTLAALATILFIAYLLYLNQTLFPFALILFIAVIANALAYAVPPLRLLQRGFGELAQAAQLAYLIPALGFALQARQNHNLLTFILLPLTTLALAYLLTLNFTTYESDQKYQRATLLRLLTWERAIPLHHSLILFAYSSFAIAAFTRFPVLWTALLTLPFGVVQILTVRHIALGGKPNWRLLTVAALAVFGLTAYFITLNFWIR